MSRPELSQQHTEFSMHVLSNQSDQLKRDGQRVINASENNNVAMLIEPRSHPFLGGVVRNIMYFLNGMQSGGSGKWNLHIFCGTQNESAIKDLFPEWDIRVTNLGVANIDANEHNKILLQKAFWECIEEENVLVFQTDCMMLRPLQDDLMKYDMIGAHYLNPHEQTPDGRGYNGGFSFRHKSAVMKCLKEVDVPAISNYRRERGKPELPSVTYMNRIAEDVFLSHAMEMLNKKLPTQEEACQFSTEAVYNRTSVGLHAALIKAFFPFELLVDMVRSSELVKYI